jgi:hypothetical protein
VAAGLRRDEKVPSPWISDLYIAAEAEAFVKWHAGQLAWADATRDRRIQLHGPTWLVRAFPTWNARSAFAHIKPVPRTTDSLAG